MSLTSKYEMIWADPGNYDEDGDELPYGAVGYAWASREEYSEPYARIGAYAKMVGEDGMPQKGRAVLLEWSMETWVSAKRNGAACFVGPGHAVVEAIDTHRWVYLDDVIAVMFGG